MWGVARCEGMLRCGKVLGDAEVWLGVRGCRGVARCEGMPRCGKE